MRLLALILFLGCGGTPAACAQAVADSDKASKLVAIEHVWAQAYMVKDPKALERVLAAGFVCVDSDGRLLNKAEVLKDVAASTAVQILTESMVVHLHGDTAIVTGIFRTKGVEHGKPFVRRERFVDTWVYRTGEWSSIASLVSVAGD